MPRVQCSFCETLVVARPNLLKDENYYPKCIVCKEGTPPDEWRCQAKVVKGRCSTWVTRKGYKYCGIHKKREVE